MRGVGGEAPPGQIDIGAAARGRSKHVAVADHRLSASLARIPARVAEIRVHVQTHYVTQRTVVSLRSVGDLVLGSLEGAWIGMYARPEEGREISQNYPCFLI